MAKKTNPITASKTPTKKKLKSLAAIAALTEKRLKLLHKEHAEAETALIEFGETVWQAEHYLHLHPYRPRSSYFLPPMIQSLLDGLMKINIMEVLATYSASWAHSSGHSAALLNLVMLMRTKFVDV